MYFFFFSIVTIVCKSNWDTSPLPHPLSNVGLCNGSVIFNIKGIHITLKPVRLLLFISYWLWVNLYAQRFVKMHSMFNLWQEKLVNRFKSTSTNQLSRFILGKVHTQYFCLPIKNITFILSREMLFIEEKNYLKRHLQKNISAMDRMQSWKWDKYNDQQSINNPTILTRRVCWTIKSLFS